MRKTRASDVMTANVATVREDTPFAEIVAVLLNHKITAVPALDSTGQVRGVVSDADLVLKGAEPDASPEGSLLESRRHRRERSGLSARRRQS